jgi:starch synthase
LPAENSTTILHDDPPFQHLEITGASDAPRIHLLELREPAGEGEIYSGDDRDAGRFLQLAEAALTFGRAFGWRPDVLHCHDWHAALVPVLRSARRAQPDTNAAPCVLTLHNIGYQGLFARIVVEQYGAGDIAGMAAQPGDPGVVNFLRAGIRYADRITTVSPTYAREIQTAAYGMGLDDVLRARRDDLLGILNGVDYGTWGPASDPYLPRPYDAGDLAPKHALKGALCDELALAQEPGAPLVGAVSRLVAQKGIDLVVEALPELLAKTRASFALLGSGDPELSTRLRSLAERHPRRISFTQGYDERLAHQILAGADLVVVPSRYEPCGLTQLYALRYGTVPVVRATGGLADTIHHFDPTTGRGNGSVFDDADTGGLLWGVLTALAWFDDAAAWSRLVANGMAADFSWDDRVGEYEAVYRRLLDGRHPQPAGPAR